MAVSLPAVVTGEKAVEAALLEGFYPVVDRTVDIFAIPSTTGKQHGAALRGKYREYPMDAISLLPMIDVATYTVAPVKVESLWTVIAMTLHGTIAPIVSIERYAYIYMCSYD